MASDFSALLHNPEFWTYVDHFVAGGLIWTALSWSWQARRAVRELDRRKLDRP